MPRSTDELSDSNIPAIFLAEAEEDDVEANLDFQAMMHLNDEESPEDSAKNYREEGNAHFRKGKSGCQSAILSYTNALRHNIDDPIFNSFCYSNRAMAHIVLENWGKACLDCGKAIELNPLNMKAYWRGTRAAMRLKKMTEARALLELGLTREPTNPDLLALKRDLEKQEEVVGTERREAADKAAQRQKKITTVAETLVARNIFIGPSLYDLRMYEKADTKITLDQAGSLHFPIIFLYPEFEQSDLVQDCQESSTLISQLEMMFSSPPPWDIREEYSSDKLVVYYKSNQTRPDRDMPDYNKYRKEWRLVDARLSLGNCLQLPGYVIPYFPLFYVFRRGSDFLKKWLSSDEL